MREVSRVWVEGRPSAPAPAMAMGEGVGVGVGVGMTPAPDLREQAMDWAIPRHRPSELIEAQLAVEILISPIKGQRGNSRAAATAVEDSSGCVGRGECELQLGDGAGAVDVSQFEEGRVGLDGTDWRERACGGWKGWERG